MQQKKYNFDWENIDVLGNGAFSDVFKVYDSEEKKFRAVHVPGPKLPKNLTIKDWILLKRNSLLISNIVNQEINIDGVKIPKVESIIKGKNPMAVMDFVEVKSKKQKEGLDSKNIYKLSLFLSALHQIPLNKFENLIQHQEFKGSRGDSFLMDSCGLSNLQKDILENEHKKVLCHGDFSLDNLSFDKDNNIVLFDWDLAQKNNFNYDLKGLYYINNKANLPMTGLDFFIKSYNDAPKDNLKDLRIHPKVPVFFAISDLEDNLLWLRYAGNNKRDDLDRAKKDIGRKLYNAQNIMSHYGEDKAKIKLTRKVFKAIKEFNFTPVYKPEV